MENVTDLHIDNFNIFVNSTIYNNMVQVIINETKIKFFEDICDWERKVIYNVLNNLNVTIEELRSLLEKDYEKIIKYSIEIIKKVKEEKPQYFVPEGVVFLKCFMFFNIFEYYLFKNNPEKLLDFFEKRDIYPVSEYEEEKRKIYNKINIF